MGFWSKRYRQADRLCGEEGFTRARWHSSLITRDAFQVSDTLHLGAMYSDGRQRVAGFLSLARLPTQPGSSLFTGLHLPSFLGFPEDKGFLRSLFETGEGNFKNALIIL